MAKEMRWLIDFNIYRARFGVIFLIFYIALFKSFTNVVIEPMAAIFCGYMFMPVKKNSEFFSTLPLRRKSVVLSEFLCGDILFIITMALSVVFRAANMYFTGGAAEWAAFGAETATTIAGTFLTMSLVMTMLYPLMIKFPDKQRIFVVLVIVMAAMTVPIVYALPYATHILVIVMAAAGIAVQALGIMITLKVSENEII